MPLYKGTFKVDPLYFYSTHSDRIIIDSNFYECQPFNPCHRGDCIQDRCCFGEKKPVNCDCPANYVGRFCQHQICDPKLADKRWKENWMYVESDPVVGITDGLGNSLIAQLTFLSFFSIGSSILLYCCAHSLSVYWFIRPLSP